MSEIADIPGMKETWQARLRAGIKANGKSQREVSLAAGMGPGYVNSLLNEGKDPTIDHLTKVVDAAGLSLSYVLFGVEIDPDTEELMQLAEQSPAKKAAVLQILRDQAATEAAE